MIEIAVRQSTLMQITSAQINTSTARGTIAACRKNHLRCQQQRTQENTSCDTQKYGKLHNTPYVYSW
jgi:hypothetical protein